ncbi:hypothetical protein BC938DRAFT_471427 [Jimgerdemannia flammicorona]|uniref:THIF-type NAD/FAD binding fold domain-containing protein n=1 Tax=Jimgerdemannia flammicorona TaxID=994334 RepID=A0A433Q807_9FUNG|nr:hypothetical protein BC938DRAFT_471427 [Jimgerdemannia flammicorona]
MESLDYDPLTLPSILLPGIGSFTIIDGTPVTGSDLGNNFFLSPTSLGQPRARAAMELLRELNEDAHGTAVERDPAELIDTEPAFFLQFSMIIATALDEPHVARLAALAWEAGIPLVIVRVAGFLGYFRVVAREHTGGGNW